MASYFAEDETARDKMYLRDAVVNDKFWIFTDLDMVQWLADKHDSIMENRNPVSTQRL